MIEKLYTRFRSDVSPYVRKLDNIYLLNLNMRIEDYYKFLIKLSTFNNNAIKFALDQYFLTDIHNTKGINYILGIARGYDPKKSNTPQVIKREFGT